VENFVAHGPTLQYGRRRLFARWRISP
jgi:hypothetical protein